MVGPTGTWLKKADGLGHSIPGTSTKKLPYYSKFFDSAEMDSTFYEKFYKYMTPATFRGMASATPDEFEFSVKVPETVTHDKKLDVSKGAITLFEEFVDKISPLKITNKLGVILIQLPPSFTVKEFKNTEQFLDRLPSGYDYAIEFRHPSWDIEGPWNMLKHYNIAAVMIDSPPNDNLEFMSDVTVTANHSFIRFHGRDSKHRYNYLYSKEELAPWASKVKMLQKETTVVRYYFNNHYGDKAVVNALQFKEILGQKLTVEQEKALTHAQNYISQISHGLKLDHYIKQ